MSDTDDSTSGYLVDHYEGISNDFTELSDMP